MKRSIARFAAVSAVSLLLLCKASALSLTDPGVVGTKEGEAGDNNDALYAQTILNLLDGQTVGLYKASDPGAPGGDTYSGTLGVGVKTDLAETDPVPSGAGYTYALGKYDGQNAGYVLFHLPTYGNVIAEFSYNIWGTSSGQYRLSHVTFYNPTGVPDGGLTVGLLGLGLAALGAARRYIRA